MFSFSPRRVTSLGFVIHPIVELGYYHIIPTDDDHTSFVPLHLAIVVRLLGHSYSIYFFIHILVQGEDVVHERGLRGVVHPHLGSIIMLE